MQIVWPSQAHVRACFAQLVDDRLVHALKAANLMDIHASLQDGHEESAWAGLREARRIAPEESLLVPCAGTDVDQAHVLSRPALGRQSEMRPQREKWFGGFSAATTNDFRFPRVPQPINRTEICLNENNEENRLTYILNDKHGNYRQL